MVPKNLNPKKNDCRRSPPLSDFLSLIIILYVSIFIPLLRLSDGIVMQAIYNREIMRGWHWPRVGRWIEVGFSHEGLTLTSYSSDA